MKNISGAAKDVLWSLYYRPLDDGDLPSKCGMSELIELGYAKKDYDLIKPNHITRKGAKHHIEILDNPF